MKYSQKIQKISNYFNSKESRLGYSLLLKGTKHFGFYPKNKENISIAEAQRLMEDKLAKVLSLPKNSFVLDAGCGEGKVAMYLAKEYGWRIIGVDLLDWAIKEANESAKRINLDSQLKFFIGDYSKLSFKDNTFNGIYTMESLVHVPDFKKVLREFYRVLKPKGKLVLFEYSVIDRKTLSDTLRKEFDFIINKTGMNSLPYFIHGRFPIILKEAGFKNVQVIDITERIMPMLKIFYTLAFLPYHFFIRPFNLKAKFINATFSVEAYQFIKQGIACYNIITATK